MSDPIATNEPRWVPGDRFFRALEYAVHLHAHQSRKNRQRDPYVAHLFAVAALVIEDGGSEEETIAALLHDAAEDHGGLATLTQIRQQFCDEVARIVDGCSDSLESDPESKPPWKDRKRRYLDHLRAADEHVRRVALADKLNNARATALDLAEGRKLGDGFKAPADDQRWYYAELLKCFEGTASRNLSEFRDYVRRIVEWRDT